MKDAPVTVIGAGAVGRSLAQALVRAGLKVMGIYSLNGTSARRLARSLRVPDSGPLDMMTNAAGTVIIAVPDDGIRTVVRHLARTSASLRGVVVLHTSGALNGGALKPLKRLGASVGSLHPMQTFPRGAVTPLAGCWMAVEGEVRAVAAARMLARRTGAFPVRIAPAQKAAYHAAGVFVSNYFVTLAGVAEELHRRAGIPPRTSRPMLAPLMRRTVENILALGPAAALTGPVERGDFRTVERHRRALAGHRFLALYDALAAETARVARRKKRNRHAR